MDVSRECIVSSLVFTVLLSAALLSEAQNSRSIDPLDSFFHDMHNMMRTESERMARMVDHFDQMERSMEDEKDCVKKGLHRKNSVSIQYEDSGCRVIVEGVDNGSINAEFQNDVLHAQIDGLTLKVVARGNKLFVETQEKHSKEKEEEGSRFVQYAQQSQSYVYPVERELDMDSLEPIYDSKKKAFELFIPYKKGRKLTIAVK